MKRITKMPSGSWGTSDRRSRLPGNWFSSIRPAVLKRDGYRCQLKLAGCLGKATDVDHIKPGDDHSMTNLQAACKTCHQQKSSDEGNRAKAALRAARFRKKPVHPGRLK